VNPRVRDQFASSRVLGFDEQTDDAVLLRIAGNGAAHAVVGLPFAWPFDTFE
jgi:hypothetical protein